MTGEALSLLYHLDWHTEVEGRQKLAVSFKMAQKIQCFLYSSGGIRRDSCCELSAFLSDFFFFLILCYPYVTCPRLSHHDWCKATCVVLWPVICLLTNAMGTCITSSTARCFELFQGLRVAFVGHTIFYITTAIHHQLFLQRVTSSMWFHWGCLSLLAHPLTRWNTSQMCHVFDNNSPGRYADLKD